MTKKTVIPILLSILAACSSNKNVAQIKTNPMNRTVLENINRSAGDTDIINPHLKQLAAENDWVMAFGTLNYAWARKGTFYVLASRNNNRKLYVYQSRLPASPSDSTLTLAPQTIPAETANQLEQLYAASELWKTRGDEDGNVCQGKKGCNINDAETWTLSIATPKNIHTTTYYAPEFFEECCPGNPYRKQFIAIAKEMMKLGAAQSPAPEK